VSNSTDETTIASETPAPASAEQTAAHGEEDRLFLRPTPERGSLVGRYIVLEKIGSGAMGVVLAAYDPDLDRKVALKLIKPRERGDKGAARVRLQREAQALGKLNHKNVVSVHDVGLHEGRVFVAMEFVLGQTLGDWMSSGNAGAPRPWRDVVARFAAAGRGLAAAHAQGLIHRDFKPDNVMLGDDGGVRVMDFGLARAHEHGAAEPIALHEVEGQDGSSLDRSLTHTGAIMGTPAYMAPEQFLGVDVTARSDQFGFCAAMFEALHGVRAFRGDTLAQLALAVTEGKISEEPGNNVPRWLRALVRRGLSVDQGARFADMPSLLASLEAGEVRRRRARIAATLGAVGLGAASLFAYQAWDTTRRDRACVADGDRVKEIWNDAVAQELHASLLATGVSYAKKTADSVLPLFSTQADALRQAQIHACRETRVYHRRDEDLLARATWCLDEGRMQLETLVAEFSAADESSVNRAVKAASRLSPPDGCNGARGLSQPPPPPQSRKAIQLVRRELLRAQALRSAGRSPDSLQVAQAALNRAEELEWPVLTASARWVLAPALADEDQLDAAEVMLEQAYFEAAQVGAHEVSAVAAIELIYTVGTRGSRYSEGHRWAKHARVALANLNEPEDGPHRAGLNHLLAFVLGAAGDLEGAQKLNQGVLASYEKRLGREHPYLVFGLTNMADLETKMGNYKEAKALLARALSIHEHTHGLEHPSAVWTLTNLGNLHTAMGEYDEAQSRIEQLLKLHEATTGAGGSQTAVHLGNLAELHRLRGNYTEAIALFERSLSIWVGSVGPAHANVGMVHTNLGLVHLALSEYEKSKSHFEKSLAIWEKLLPAEHPDFAWPLTGLAEVALAEGRSEDALALAQRGLKNRVDGKTPAQYLATSQFVTAQALWQVGGSGEPQRERALELANKARAAWLGAKANEAELALVERWIAAHSGGAQATGSD
jgi:tetratricopeptide (TPR) repeat protein/tRNA A-37 threonylcarbamoyl transferase component Bud32